MNNRLVLTGVILAAIVLTGLFAGSFDTAKQPLLTGLGTLTAAWLTICIFSFLYKDNPLYKFAEHIMVGLAMGYFAIYYAYQILERQWFNRLFLNELAPGEEIFGSSQVFRFALIIPAIFGLLMLTRVTPKFGWLSRWSMALVIGLGSGIAIPWTIQANITSQLLAAAQLPAQYVEALNGAPLAFTDVAYWEVGVPLLIVGTLCGLVYFFFSVSHRGVIGKAATFGIWVLMVGFGTSFGLTVMARLSLFIGRILFLLKNWLGLIA